MIRGNHNSGGDFMKQIETGTCFRLNPELRLCPKFDSDSIAEFRVANRRCMGMRVLDNCAEEHIM